MSGLELASIPRALTAFAEWSACTFYLLMLAKRFGRVKTAVIMGLAGILQFALQFWAKSIVADYWAEGMLVNVAFMLVYVYICAETDIKGAFCVGAKAFVTAEFIASFEWLVICMVIEYVPGISKSVPLELAIAAVLTTLYFFATYQFEKRNHLLEKKLDYNGLQVISIVFMAVLVFAGSNLAFSQMEWRENWDLQFSLCITRALVDFCGLSILFFQQKLLQDQKMQMEMDSINHTLELQYKQYRDFKENSEFISRQYHDLKHQMDAIRTCTEEERAQYLSEMENMVKMYEAWNVTGNSTLDSILTQKKIYCIQHDIQFSCTADGRLLDFISVRDICSIFGNILDNAIEHVSMFEDIEKRQIRGEVYQKNSFLLICFENYCEEKIYADGGLPGTTKQDKKLHGYGLKSIQYIVKKYNGTMTLETEDNWFSIKLLIPVKKDDMPD